MSWKIPSIDEMCKFTASQNQLDKIKLDYLDVQNTYYSKTKNPYAYGNLAAFKFAYTELVGKPNFPVQDNLLNNEKFNYKNLDKYIWWLKKLNYIVFEPITRDPILKDNENSPKKWQLGTWRQTSSTNLNFMAPDPELIPKIMFVWLRDFAIVNKTIMEKIDNPTELNQNLAKKIPAICYEQSFFFSIVQPFAYGNNQMGRWMENILRWQWKMPLKIRMPDSPEYKKWTDNLEKWEKQRLSKFVSKAREL